MNEDAPSTSRGWKVQQSCDASSPSSGQTWHYITHMNPSDMGMLKL